MNLFLYQITLGISGIYAGACLSIACVDLPYVRTIGPETEAVRIFGELLTRMGKIMLPQLGILLLGISYFSMIHFRKASGSVFLAYLPLFLFSAIAIITITVHIPINQAVISNSVSPGSWENLVSRWYIWHWVRSIIAFGLVISLFSSHFLTNK
ncbi:hypothetical protein CH373_05210 [Leptospira perolatii]|uniref:DUF1772 domain-containing protein n=1 Tax=Leptospira perolatii TaxID=2023191 RepID=A0A2M9ZQE7_9LEPT|nr:DUF1772 domain-containing protein [Leptospira perolatii]PJZ70472.1 hypothetical protein CH360_05630 [Leptospira perolatii]PJZ74308.1 hypothetical protein CH373_05210 [Leptospira perolatii]